MEWIQLAVLISALLCTLVTGFVLCFVIIVMPGIKTLGTANYLRSFKAMDGIIQDNQPLFLLIWLGSALAILISTLLGVWQLHGFNLALLIFACVIYLFGVHLPTITINIPINNRLQALDLDKAAPSELEAIAEVFDTRWMRWNTIRTGIGMLTSVILLVLLVRI